MFVLLFFILFLMTWAFFFGGQGPQIPIGSIKDIWITGMIGGEKCDLDILLPYCTEGGEMGESLPALDSHPFL